MTSNNDDGVYFLSVGTQRAPSERSHVETKLRRWGGNSSGVNVANIDKPRQYCTGYHVVALHLGNVRERSRFGDLAGCFRPGHGRAEAASAGGQGTLRQIPLLENLQAATPVSRPAADARRIRGPRTPGCYRRR